MDAPSVGFAMDKGYGKIKGATFRLPHMGDVSMAMLREVLDGLGRLPGAKYR